MDYLDIRFALAKKGYTLTKVAGELDLAGPQSVSQVLQRAYRSKRVEMHVAGILGVSAAHLFPDRYKRKKRA